MGGYWCASNINKLHETLGAFVVVVVMLLLSKQSKLGKCTQIRSKLSIFYNCGVNFSVCKIIYWIGNFGQ